MSGNPKTNEQLNIRDRNRSSNPPSSGFNVTQSPNATVVQASTSAEMHIPNPAVNRSASQVITINRNVGNIYTSQFVYNRTNSVVYRSHNHIMTNFSSYQQENYLQVSSLFQSRINPPGVQSYQNVTYNHIYPLDYSFNNSMNSNVLRIYDTNIPSTNQMTGPAYLNFVNPYVNSAQNAPNVFNNVVTNPYNNIVYSYIPSNVAMAEIPNNMNNMLPGSNMTPVTNFVPGDNLSPGISFLSGNILPGNNYGSDVPQASNFSFGNTFASGHNATPANNFQPESSFLPSNNYSSGENTTPADSLPSENTASPGNSSSAPRKAKVTILQPNAKAFIPKQKIHETNLNRVVTMNLKTDYKVWDILTTHCTKQICSACEKKIIEEIAVGLREIDTENKKCESCEVMNIKQPSQRYCCSCARVFEVCAYCFSSDVPPLSENQDPVKQLFTTYIHAKYNQFNMDEKKWFMNQVYYKWYAYYNCEISNPTEISKELEKICENIYIQRSR